MSNFYPTSYHHFYETKDSNFIPFNSGPSTAGNAEAPKFLSLPIKRNVALKPNLHVHPAPAAVTQMMKAVTAAAKKAINNGNHNTDGNGNINAAAVAAEAGGLELDSMSPSYHYHRSSTPIPTGTNNLGGSASIPGSPVRESLVSNINTSSNTASNGIIDSNGHLSFQMALEPVIWESINPTNAGNTSFRPGSPIRPSSSPSPVVDLERLRAARASRAVTAAVNDQIRTASLADAIPLRDLILSNTAGTRQQSALHDEEKDTIDDEAEEQYLRTAAMLLPTTSQWNALDELRVHAGAPERTEKGIEKLTE
jgi:hypothetical protein